MYNFMFNLFRNFSPDPAILAGIAVGLTTGALLPAIAPPILSIVGFSPTGIRRGESCERARLSAP
jgi:hypothetical protein